MTVPTCQLLDVLESRRRLCNSGVALERAILSGLLPSPIATTETVRAFPSAMSSRWVNTLDEDLGVEKDWTRCNVEGCRSGFRAFLGMQSELVVL